MNIIEKYKDQIEAGLELAAERFLLDTQSTHLSPRWFNTFGVALYEITDNAEEFVWRIKSTQIGIGFDINVTEEEADYIMLEWEDAWQDFKRFRTQWLEENYPQIPRY